MLLALKGGGRCAKCQQKLTAEFHADHIRPHSKGGSTTTNNGQALCAPCNLRKGATWQS